MNRSQPRRTPPKKHAPTSWGSVADWYEKHLEGKDTYHEKVLLPNIMRLLEAKKTDHVLDVPCGQGYFATQLAPLVKSVTGVDISPELVGKAKRTALSNMRYIGTPAHKLGAIDDASMHRALCVLGIQNIHEVPEMLHEIHRTLKEGGTLLIVMNHPAFRIPKRSAWEWDKDRHTQFRRLDAYMSESAEEIVMHPGEDEANVTVSFHRPLQWYVKHLAKAGFVIDRLEEWVSHKVSDSGPRAKAENTARKEFPLFLALRVRKS